MHAAARVACGACEREAARLEAAEGARAVAEEGLRAAEGVGAIARGARGADSMSVAARERAPACPPAPPPSRTKWTRRVPHPVLIGHAASLTPY